MLGYFAGNCGSCHRGDGEIAPRLPSLRYSDLPATAMRWPGVLSGGARRGKYPVPARAAACSSIRRQTTSAMFLRMRSRNPSSQMPPLGTVLRDEKAIDALSKWISGDLSMLVQDRRPEHAAR